MHQFCLGKDLYVKKFLFQMTQPVRFHSQDNFRSLISLVEKNMHLTFTKNRKFNLKSTKLILCIYLYNKYLAFFFLVKLKF